MAPMAASQPLMRSPMVAVGQRRRWTTWALWILVSVIGAAAGAIVAWEIRSLVMQDPASQQLPAIYAAAAVSALILGSGQWLVLRHYRVDAFWWVPATVGANLVAAAIIVPGVISLALRGGISPLNSNTAVVFGAIALSTGGLVVGTAQALVLRDTGGHRAWLWIPATILGGALAGALTTALSPSLIDAVAVYGLPVFALISLSSALGSLLISACQAPIVARVLR